MHSPLHQFLIRPLISFEIAGVDLSFTNASLFMLLATLLPMILFLLVRKNLHLEPGILQAVLETSYLFVANILKETNGEKGLAYFPLVFSLFIFLLFGNMLGMLPYSFTFTSQIAVTFSLAALLFCLITLIGVLRHGFNFFSIFWPSGVPWFMAPLLVPVELLSYLSRPISLGVRLFANMMAGHTMLKVFGGFTLSLGVWGIGPLAINVALTGFEIMVSFLQAYVFTILTCIYFHDALYLHSGDH
jgi:F-type H+-transporting ATPase subunit a